MYRFTGCVTIVGLGGVGGAVAMQAARLLPYYDVKRLILYDPDVVERRNLEGQIYFQSDVGDEENPKRKIDGVRRQLDDLPHGECVIEYHAERVDSSTPLRGILIVAVDSLKARQDIFNALDYKNGKSNFVPLLIEARVGENGNYAIVYVVDPNDPEQMKVYRNKVFWEEGESAPPNDRCVPANIGALLAGAIAGIVKKFWEEHWRPLHVTVGIVDCGTFPMVKFMDVRL